MFSQTTRCSCSRNLPLIVIIVAFILWGLCYIWGTSFPINGKRYFCLFDDAMVSMQYAQNLAHGHGLVWNQGGERVEGFTNPLWTFIMTIVHLVGVSKGLASLYVQLIGLVVLAANIACVYMIALRMSGDNSVPCAIAAAFLTAFCLPLNTWGLQGMEVSLVTLLISASILLVMQRIETQQSMLGVFILLGTGILVRPDGVISYVVMMIFLAVFLKYNRRRQLFLGLSFLAVILLVVTAVRYLYFNELFPNTYYLKMAGVSISERISRGLHMLIGTIEAMGAGLVAICVAYSVSRIYRKEIALLCSLLIGQIVYSVYVGGDAWEWFGPNYPNRYLCAVIPCFFILFTLVAKRLLLDSDPAVSQLFPRCWSVFRIFVFAFLIGVAWLGFHGSTQPWKARLFLGNMRVLRGTPLHVMDNSHNVALALWLRETCPADTKVAVEWAGAQTYFSGLATIDLLGKCDKKIAKMDCTGKGPGTFYPGHNKYDLTYSIGVLKPEVVLTRGMAKNYPGYVGVGNIHRLFMYVRQDRVDLIHRFQSKEQELNNTYMALCSYWHVRPWKPAEAGDINLR